MKQIIGGGARLVQYVLALFALYLVAALLPGDSVNVNVLGALVLLGGIGLVALALQPFARHAGPARGGRYNGRG